MDWLKKIDDFLDGKKTYICIALILLTGFLDVKGLIPETVAPYKMEIYLALLAGAGISARRGITRVASKLKNEVKRNGTKAKRGNTNEGFARKTEGGAGDKKA